MKDQLSKALLWALKKLDRNITNDRPVLLVLMIIAIFVMVFLYVPMWALFLDLLE